jgi:hypothetical protein
MGSLCTDGLHLIALLQSELHVPGQAHAGAISRGKRHSVAIECHQRDTPTPGRTTNRAVSDIEMRLRPPKMPILGLPRDWSGSCFNDVQPTPTHTTAWRETFA